MLAMLKFELQYYEWCYNILIFRTTLQVTSVCVKVKFFIILVNISDYCYKLDQYFSI